MCLLCVRVFVALSLLICPSPPGAAWFLQKNDCDKGLQLKSLRNRPDPAPGLVGASQGQRELLGTTLGCLVPSRK